jgi:hypothetical protein
VKNWMSTKEMARRCGVSATTLCNWVKRSREDEEYYPKRLRAVAGQHYVRNECRRGGRYGWEYRFNPSKVSKELLHRAKLWAQKGDTIELQLSAQASGTPLPALEAHLRDKAIYCNIHGELSMERCRLCWLLKSDQEKERTGNWEICRRKNWKKGE